MSPARASAMVVMSSVVPALAMGQARPQGPLRPAPAPPIVGASAPTSHTTLGHWKLPTRVVTTPAITVTGQYFSVPSRVVTTPTMTVAGRYFSVPSRVVTSDTMHVVGPTALRPNITAPRAIQKTPPIGDAPR